MRRLVAPLLVLLCLAAPAAAQSTTKADRHLNQGDYLFKAGYFLKASEQYRLALLEDPSSPLKKLAFGHALFAIGNYSYASYALRRGVAELNERQVLRPDVAALFPSRRAFTQALRDLKRYVTYSPRDPAGLTVLGYVLFSVAGEERRCRDMFNYLQRLDKNDPFARFFLRQLTRRAKMPPLAAGKPPPAPVEVEPIAPELKPEPVVVPKPAPLKEIIPKPGRQGERVVGDWPKPVASPAK